MKLYLSSYRIPDINALTSLLPKVPGEVRAVIIPNAKDYYAERAWNFKIQECVSYLSCFGFKSEVIDLREHNSASLQKVLQNVDFMWVCGGNTFCLREAMQTSGFDTLIGPMLAKGVVYAGESAGAVVAGKTLKGVEFADQPEFAGRVLYDGLSLIDKIIIPHADSIVYGDAISKMKELHAGDRDAIVLKDSQAYRVNDDTAVIVTAQG